MSFSLERSGSNFKKAEAWLNRLRNEQMFTALNKGGAAGVAALKAATPIDSGESASAWTYEIRNKRGEHEIVWINTHLDDNGGGPVVILLQLGHGTGTGGYVQGRDFINPALKPIFEQIKADVRKAVQAR